jgi:hypothetical protein
MHGNGRRPIHPIRDVDRDRVQFDACAKNVFENVRTVLKLNNVGTARFQWSPKNVGRLEIFLDSVKQMRLAMRGRP